MPAPRAVRAMSRFPPRNAPAIVAARERGEMHRGDAFAVSFVGPTKLPMRHVFVDEGRSYEWDFASGLHAWVVVHKGVDAGRLMAEIFAATLPYPTLVDFERLVVGSLIDTKGGFRLWPVRRGSAPWQELFA